MRLRPILKPVLNRILPPLTKLYLRKPRVVHYDGLDIRVEPGVFHPGLYFSTKLLIEHLRGIAPEGKRVLEIGVGSGMISIWAARAGAQVTGIDISGNAVECARKNGASNGVDVHWKVSDLFAALPPQKFDLILVNPPYYPGNPKNEEEQAWYCGEEYQYFQRLFQDLGEYLNKDSQFRMVLSEDCALDRIGAIARAAGWPWQELSRSRRWGELNYIFGWN